MPTSMSSDEIAGSSASLAIEETAAESVSTRRIESPVALRA